MLTLEGFQDRLDRFIKSKKMEDSLEVSKFIEKQSEDYEVHPILLSEYDDVFAKIFQDKQNKKTVIYTVEDLMYEVVLRIIIKRTKEITSREYFYEWTSGLYKFFMFSDDVYD